MRLPDRRKNRTGNIVVAVGARVSMAGAGSGIPDLSSKTVLPVCVTFGLAALTLFGSFFAAQALNVIDAPVSEFDFHFSEDKSFDVDSCNLDVIIAHIPETVDLRVTFGKDKLSRTAIQLNLYVAETTFTHGIPDPPSARPIEFAEVASDSWDSKTGMKMVGADSGNGIFYLGGDSAIPLIPLIVSRGYYYIHFRRSDRTDETAYVVRETPPASVRQQFDECITSLLQ
jgi:hypothetical protein